MDFFRRLFMFVAGLLAGFGAGVAASQLTTPMSGRELADAAQARLDALKQEALRASQVRQAELRAELAEMTGGAVTLTSEVAESEAGTAG